MGKKVKTGKARKDKFYKLAKESGYRSRAAFKLLQLNRKFQFLEKSRVCIDLCAAPGGWLQVAQQNMPMSSLIIGVDLVPIKPIHNVVALQEDITTDKCRQALKKELHTWKADVVLHDGAPNVGRNWVHDAFQQAQLTLQALKLATVFLRKGGWFVSKVFRSKDYHALLWVFKQLFKSVHATKPLASRTESAEIFVVCQHYKAPDKLDPRFLDIRHVFKDVNMTQKQGLDLIHPEKVKKRAEGYDETDTSFHCKLLASQFINSENYLELLSNAHEIVIDTEEIDNNPLTTTEIKLCCKDVKVLGRKEIRLLINWRKKLNKELEEKMRTVECDSEGKGSDSEKNQDEDMEVEEQIENLTREQAMELKRKRKKVMKEKRKLRDKMELKMIHPGDHIEQNDDIDLFNIKKIKSKHELLEVQKEDLPEEMPGEQYEDVSNKKRKVTAEDDITYMDHGEDIGDLTCEDKTDESSEDEIDSDLDEENRNPLIVDLEGYDVRIQRKTNMWFSKEMFSGVEADVDEDIEIKKMTDEYRKHGGMVIDVNREERKCKKHEESDDSEHVSDKMEHTISYSAESCKGSEDDKEHEDVDDSDDDESDSDSDVHASLQRTLVDKQRGAKHLAKVSKNNSAKDGFEIVPASAAGKIIKLDPVELAIGEQLIKSAKSRKEIEELSYNRYTQGEEDVPEWFAEDEAKHNRKQLPVTKEQVEYYKQQLKDINARPIKKIAEAKARKKQKMAKKLERVRKKAEAITDAVEISEAEKWKQIKEIYKKAGLLNKKKRQVTYVVAKKGGGKKPTRPAGVKGFYKIVDKRMKKDKLHEKRLQAKQKRKKTIRVRR